MSSINTNMSAVNALQALRATNSAMTTTQRQVSTGLKVETARDNASAWAISETMKGDKQALQTVAAGLDVNQQMLGAFADAFAQINDQMQSIKNDLMQLRNQQANPDEIYPSLNAAAETINSIAQNTIFNGVNIFNGTLHGDAPGSGFIELMSFYINGGTQQFTQTTQVVTIQFDVTVPLVGSFLLGAGGGGLLDGSGVSGIDWTFGASAGGPGTADSETTLGNAGFDPTDPATVDPILALVDTAIAESLEYGAELGAKQAQAKSQAEFVKVMVDVYTGGISSLVDADMEEASTRLQALQVQQQLGVQSLAIANQSQQLILQLFQ